MKFYEMHEPLQCLAEELNKGHTGVANELERKIGVDRGKQFHYFNRKGI